MCDNYFITLVCTLRKECDLTMRFEFDDFNFKDQVEFMNLNKQMQQNHIENNQIIGFNSDIIYNFIENKDNNKNI